jgi:hypothetical protein
MMQWLDMFCCREFWHKKSLKMELQLKSNKGLKFKGLDLNYNLKLRATLEFVKRPRALVQDSQDYSV